MGVTLGVWGGEMPASRDPQRSIRKLEGEPARGIKLERRNHPEALGRDFGRQMVPDGW